MLVVLDDMALPLGKLRLRPSGSAGGHNGLKSIIEHFGTQAVPRLRVGIGAAQARAVDHVLGRFALEEKAAAGAESRPRAGGHRLRRGPAASTAAMNAFN